MGCIKEEWEAAGVKRRESGTGALSAMIKPPVVGIWECVLVAFLVAVTKSDKGNLKKGLFLLIV